MNYSFTFSNRYGEALANYEKGMDKTTLDRINLTETELEEHKRLCDFGIARTNIKLGNFKKGVIFKSKSTLVNRNFLFQLLCSFPDWISNGAERQTIV